LNVYIFTFANILFRITAKTSQLRIRTSVLWALEFSYTSAEKNSTHFGFWPGLDWFIHERERLRRWGFWS